MREAIAVCHSLPRPLAIQVGIYISYLRAGFWGAWAFIFPNFLIVAALGALYVHLGDLKPVTAVFYGVSPAVIALILHSCYRLAKLGMEDWIQWAVAAVRPCGHHRDLRRLSRSGLLGLARLDGRDILSLLHLDPHRRSDAGASPRKCERVFSSDTIAIGAVSLSVLFRWRVSNPALIAATAVVGLIAYPLVEPTWVMVR
jgi:Chromate transporter